jgi:hypothetical protein
LGFLKEGNMSWDLDKTVAALRENAGANSRSKCAAYVRMALEAGGVTLTITRSAKDYGQSLELAGFRVVNRHSCVIAHRGDVAIIQPVISSEHGHMTMFDGEIWISDFKQRSMYPGPEYRKQQPDFAIYRKWE